MHLVADDFVADDIRVNEHPLPEVGIRSDASALVRKVLETLASFDQACGDAAGCVGPAAWGLNWSILPRMLRRSSIDAGDQVTFVNEGPAWARATHPVYPRTEAKP
jgi:hypothetical protein